MRIIHTADWHLGQTFFEHDRAHEHTCFLSWLQQQIVESNADILLIAGDIFDTANPSAASQRQFYRFLRDVTTEKRDLQIVIIAGNHDSASRLEAPTPLLEEMDITVRGIVRRTADGEIDENRLIVPLKHNGRIEAYCLAVPYLRQGDYPPADSYAHGVASLYKTLYEKAKSKNMPIVAMGHLQATGSEIAENDRSERTIIGGLECVNPDAFDTKIRYTALGHLHKSQRVSGRENVRYAGAPLPMSFAEKNNRHGVILVDILPDKTEIDFLPFTPPVQLISLHGTTDEVFDAITNLPVGEVTNTSPYLEIKIHISRPEPDLRQQLESALTGHSVRLTRLTTDTAGCGTNKEAHLVDKEIQEISPIDIAQSYYEAHYGEKIPEDMSKLLHQIMQEITQ